MSYKIAVRIVTADFYMSQPVQDLDVMYSDFKGASIHQVPIVRIFGSTDSGKKICLHVHGVFPYFYIPYDETENVNVLKYQIAASIDKAINVSFGQASSSAQHVYKIQLVSGIPFYGYHIRQHQFLKIFLYNPILIRKVGTLLQNESILGKLYQPHEIHIPYILQFMIDYNLHGMSRILLADLNFRTDLNNDLPKQSYCELEADAVCEHIINRLEVSNGNMGINPGIAALWEDEKQRLRNQDEDSEIGQCLTLENSQVEPTKSHQLFKQALFEKLVILGEPEFAAESSNQNISVYPAETPEDTHLKEASFIDFHSPQSASSESMNDSFDPDAILVGNDKLLFNILQSLAADNNAAKNRADEDSILSQIPKDYEIDEDDENLNRSIAETTPVKNYFNEFDDDLNLSWDLDLDTTLIPQLDGHNDSNSDDERNNSKRKKPRREQKIKCKFKPLPISVSPFVKSGNKVYQESERKRNIDESLEAVKRQLSFQSEKTIIEDIIDCQYMPVEPKNERICDVTFSATETRKIFQTSPLNVAQLYDLETNYRAKEGCSTVLTQSSTDSFTDLCHNSRSSNELTQKQLKSSSENHMFKYLSSEGPDLHGDSQFVITPKLRPPSPDEVITCLEELKLPHVVHKKPFYSKVTDVTGSVEIGHTILKVTSNTTAHLDDFKTYFNGFQKQRRLFEQQKVNNKTLKLSFCGNQSFVVTPLKEPPTVQSVEACLKNNRLVETDVKRFSSEKKQKIYIPSSPGDGNDSDMDLSLALTQGSNETFDKVMPSHVQHPKKASGENSARISGITLDNTFGFKNSPFNCQDAKTVNEFQYLTIFSMELHVSTRGDLKPDPAYDQVKAIFYSVLEDRPNPHNQTGVIVNGCMVKENEVRGWLQCVQNENELFEVLARLIQEMDPDILTGYETELLSWGYLLERAQILENPLLVSMSRIKNHKINKNEDRSLMMTGRIVLDFWRLLRHEVALQSYTFENIVYQILQRRVPAYSFRDLTVWWDDPSNLFRHRTIEYYIYRVEAIMKIMDQLDLIGRTSELARLFGIQFYEVLSRGSQFRVESMMLRLAKPMNYIPVSPSVEQRAKMKAPEFLPLILEPESKFYIDPVIVLDFQSLYPSIIIAYNYCFSTCIGKVMNLGKDAPFEFGATQYRISRTRLHKLLNADALNFSPCGVAFVKKHIRDGIMPRMLREILDTRLMVKKSMKKNKNNKLLQKVLHNRQLGLKLIANVTYGYTAANFSGRMPAVELADSVVSKGRETLQRAIALVESTEEWGARVVYGDTDSLFVMIPGRSKSDAFEIGKKIADAVTADNPDPVKLKLEKVYHPCVLQTKKRYVGYMYESMEQSEPVYDAKGIETVRRDGCPAVSKMLEKCLRLLFETKDVSLVKQYVLRQFNKIVTGRVSLQDLTFAKEYRGAAGYRPGACVPALELCRKWTAVDKRNEPRTKERVPYIIANGPPGVPLIRLVRSPRDFLSDSSLRPNAIYYITKVIIPPINRCFNLVGVNVNSWFNQMPRKQLQYLSTTSPSKKSTISQYFSSTSCAACSEQNQTSLCQKCENTPQKSVFVLMEKMVRWEQAFHTTNTICETCTGIYKRNTCISLDCPVLYRVNQTSRDFQQVDYVRQVISLLEDR